MKGKEKREIFCEEVVLGVERAFDAMLLFFGFVGVL